MNYGWWLGFFSFAYFYVFLHFLLGAKITLLIRKEVIDNTGTIIKNYIFKENLISQENKHHKLSEKSKVSLSLSYFFLLFFYLFKIGI